MGLLLSGCNIYFNGTDGAANGVGNDGMHVTFAISAGHPDYAGTKASSYGTPSLEDGTEWENHINITGGDYLFYLFDANGVFREILFVKDIASSDNNTFIVQAEAREIYRDFTIVALANWRNGGWDMLASGNAYPVLTAGASTIDKIWTGTAGLRVYDASSRTFTPSATSLIPMYGARTYNLEDSDFTTEEISLGTIYLIRSLAKVDVYVDSTSGITLNSVQLNCYSNCFHCAPVGMTAMDDEWDHATDDTMNTNLVQVSFSPSSLDFVKIGTNLYRLYIPEYPNKRTDVERASISVSMTQDKVTTGGTILFEGKSSTSSTSKTALNILRNSYYKFCITGINKYSTEAVFDVVPFDDVNNDIVFE